MDIQGFEEFEEFLTRILERNYRRLPARQSEAGGGDGDDRNRRTGGYGNYGGRRGYGGDRCNNTAISRQTAAAGGGVQGREQDTGGTVYSDDHTIQTLSSSQPAITSHQQSDGNVDRKNFSDKNAKCGNENDATSSTGTLLCQAHEMTDLTRFDQNLNIGHRANSNSEAGTLWSQAQVQPDPGGCVLKSEECVLTNVDDQTEIVAEDGELVLKILKRDIPPDKVRAVGNWLIKGKYKDRINEVDLSTKSRRLQRTRRKRTELESVGTSSRRCSPSLTWIRNTSRSRSSSRSCPTQQEGGGGSCEQTRVSGHKDCQYCSV